MKKLIGPIKFNKVQKMVIGIAILSLVGVLVYIKIKPDLVAVLPKKDINVIETIAEDGGTIIEIDEGDKIDVDKQFPMDMSETGIQNFIHQMTHQKIVAENDEKWGMIPMTEERIVRLLDVAEKNKANYKGANTYIRILTRWYNGDFSEIDVEHNIIWSMQGGNVGRATGILSYEEEIQYIEQNFDVNR